MVAKSSNSVINFDPAQRRFFDDDSRIQVVNFHRQKGKDFTAAAKADMNALESGDDWFIVSLTQRQADATFAKCKMHAQALHKAMRLKGELTFSEYEFPAFDRMLKQEFVFTAREIRFPGGGRVVSLPGRDPDTLAGLTGNVIFTEFGLFPNGGYDHWRVVFPLTTRGFRCIVISTPRGKNHKFFELCSNPDLYSYHKCDIVKSIEEGFVLRDQNGDPCDLQTFKDLYGDEQGFLREYMCEFTGDLDTLIRMSMLQMACSKPIDFDLLHLSNDSHFDPTFFNCDIPRGCRLEIGWDVARVHDLSCVFANLTRPDGIKQLRKLCVMKNCTFPLMRAVVCAAMDVSRTNVGCGDATGMGIESNEALHAKYGDRWLPVQFNVKTKSELGSLLATTFSDGSLMLPPMDGDTKFIAHDFYAIQREHTNDGRLKLVEDSNPLMPDSHCDIAYAGALALRAGGIVAYNPRMTLL